MLERAKAIVGRCRVRLGTALLLNRADVHQAGIETYCGFDSGPKNGADLLASLGPTLIVHAGFDPDYVAGAGGAPSLHPEILRALVDTGASSSGIDASVAKHLKLPLIDRREVSGVHGRKEVDIYLAQVHVPSLGFTIHGEFSGVDMIAGGEPHHVLIGRSFLRTFTMIYEGTTGSVTLRSTEGRPS